MNTNKPRIDLIKEKVLCFEKVLSLSIEKIGESYQLNSKWCEIIEKHVMKSMKS